MDIDAQYTRRDHASRDEDAYALLKYRLTLKWIRSFGYAQNARLLNVGAGSGTFSEYAAEAGLNVLSVEPDSVAARMAQQRLGEARVLNIGIEEIPESETYDVVVMHDVLEHIEDTSTALQKVFTLCGSGSHPSLFIASVPAWQWLYGYHDEQLGHYRRYSPKVLRRELGEYFTVQNVRQLGLLGIPAALWYSKLRRTSYPVGSGGIAERVFSASCRVEESLATPLGSSVLCAAVPKTD